MSERYGTEDWSARMFWGGDAAYLALAAKETDSDPVEIWTDDTLLEKHGLLLDFAGNGRLLGVEFLDLSKLPPR